MKRKQQWLIRFSAILLLLCLFTQLAPMASAKRFTDVTRSAYPDYFDAINYVVDNGIMNGVSNTEFAPDAHLTRAMFITTLHRYAGTPNDYATMPFNDVSSGHWAYNAIRWGVKQNIVGGTSPTTFSPDDLITREQAMTFLWRYLVNYQHTVPYYYSTIANCSDYSSISNYARNPVYWAVSNGIIFPSGSSKLLYPTSYIYRKELALWINRYSVNVDGIRFGQDNFSYYNSADSFDLDSYGRMRLSEAHYNWLTSKMTTSEWALADAKIKSAFQGDCFGMVLSAILDKRGIIDFNKNLTINCATMYDMPAPSLRSNKHIFAYDRNNPSYTFAASENIIAFYSASRFATRIFNYKYFDHPGGESVTFVDMLSDLRINGCILFEFSFSFNGIEKGHVVVAYGMPVLKDGYYQIRCYDPNNGTEQTLKVSANYSSCIFTFANQTIIPYKIIYCPDFFSIASAFDIDGEYNNSYSSLESTYANCNSVDKSQASLSSQLASNEVWINLQNLGSSTITNAEGETLVYEKGKVSGTMEILDFRCGFDYFGYKVAASDFFSLQSNSNDIIFSIEWEDAFNALVARNAQRVSISKNTVAAEGPITDYSIISFADTQSDQCYKLCGQEADSIRLNVTENSATAESSSAYVLASEGLRSKEVFSMYESTDGAVATIQCNEAETAVTSPANNN